MEDTLHSKVLGVASDGILVIGITPAWNQLIREASARIESRQRAKERTPFYKNFHKERPDEIYRLKKKT